VGDELLAKPAACVMQTCIPLFHYSNFPSFQFSIISIFHYSTSIWDSSEPFLTTRSTKKAKSTLRFNFLQKLDVSVNSIKDFLCYLRASSAFSAVKSF